MNSSFQILLLALLFWVNGQTILAQPENDLFIPTDIRKAYAKQSRSMDGMPGQKYFQNQADYRITAQVDPFAGTISGEVTIDFINRSGRNLKYLVIRNYHNVFKSGAVRGRSVDPADEGKEMVYTRLVVNGKESDPDDPQSYYATTQTNIVLPCQTAHNDTSRIEISWKGFIPEKTHQRFGYVDNSSFFMAYWFPQVAVFDDINSWDVFDYNNLNEPYNEFGNFDVRLSLPEGFLVWATGELVNPGEVLGDEFLARYNESKNSEQPVKIISEQDLANQKKTGKDGPNEWHFRAEMVSDFAFGSSNHYLWSASSYTSPEGKKTHCHTAWLPSSLNFSEIPSYLPWMMKELSENVAGYPFPYPSVTVFNGLDGMEFPMIVNDTEMDGMAGTYFLTSHEIAHSYFPFLVGINQRRHGWMDEGLVTMLGVDTHTRKLNEMNFRDTYLEWYPLIAGSQEDVPPMVNSVFITDLIYQQHEYVRPSMAFWILKDILGGEMFRKCLNEFTERWKYKHPTPYDLFFTFNQVSGENLNWFFQSWFLEFAYPDLSVQTVNKKKKSWQVEIRNIGGLPFPAVLEARSGEEVLFKRNIDAREWAKGNSKIILSIPANNSVDRIVLNTEGFPDTDKSNQVWIVE